MTDCLIPQPQPHLLCADDWTDYELLDSGDGRKLERFGRYSFVRPEPQAMWAPRLGDDVWQAADGRFIAGAGRSDDEEEGGGTPGGGGPLGFDGSAHLKKSPLVP